MSEIAKTAIETSNKNKTGEIVSPSSIEGMRNTEGVSVKYPALFEKPENLRVTIEDKVRNYFDDLRNRSEYPETIRPFTTSDLGRLTPEETAIRREEFCRIKPDLKRQWENINGFQWPKYENDVYSESGKLIRKAGSDYDAHHVQPLGLGGKNEVSNITPIRAEFHYDKQGVHAINSPYSDLNKTLGGISL